MDTKFIKKLIQKESKYYLYFGLSLILLLIMNLLAIIPPKLFQNIVDLYIPNKNLKSIYITTAVMVLIPFLSTTIDTYFTYVVWVKVKELSFIVKSRIFSKLLNQPMSFYKDNDSGKLASYLAIDTSNFFYFWLHDLPTAISSGIMSIVILVLLYKISPLITIIMVLAGPAAVLPSFFLGKKSQSLAAEIVDYDSEINSKITESFKFVKLIKSQCSQKQRIDEINTINAKNLKIFGKAVITETLSLTVSKELVGAIFTAIAFILCSIGVMNNNITIGELIAFTAYLPRLFGLFNVLSSSNVYIQKQLGLQNKNFEFLAMDDEYKNSPTKSGQEILGSVTFNNLKFSYDDSRDILKNISFSINQGEFVTIMGDSGCGKSTMLDLLLDFYKAPPNSIKIDGMDINLYPLDYLRSNIALVSQNISLLRGSLRYNLALAYPKATDEDILRVIEEAELSDVVNKLPEGLDTDLSENGVNLSGGERQRLALAMALLRKPKILLLDEVSASLDLEAEKRILDTIERLCRNENLTVISVTHRRSFIKDSFRVLAMENGEVKYDGQYKDYLERSCVV
ncbi:ABC-type multidrug transport system fused ATPase/permease subunit [Clostridium punense]|uniref:ABC-type multidrug transport system fused ATPase/permease subunit n=1 Tax=Clostridium punense TaxID=1054297 RepID=A0ABS4K3M0_9CLOT|nr:MULTISPECIES: ABC transporter ATP-binding protein [Clostridium]EQB86004.1 hypothetical protein M918_16510 [Clostridium sp. BL8]MBP2022370.1 ABC-type multidrug transport system fused ATPase/permease subunit [Clostridium punense]